MDVAFLAEMTTGPIKAFIDSDGVGQAIVLLQLCMSVASWAVIAKRILELRDQAFRSARFVDDFAVEEDPLALYYKRYAFQNTAMENIYRRTCERLAALIPERQRVLLRTDPDTPLRLGAARMELVESTCVHATDEETVKLGHGSTILAVITSSAPLLGLFGTVWGVMLAFQAMANSGSANIAELAPGISSALLTTVVGLIVAIPSTIFYNALQAKIEASAVQVEGFAEELMGKLTLHYRKSEG